MKATWIRSLLVCWVCSLRPWALATRNGDCAGQPTANTLELIPDSMPSQSLWPLDFVAATRPGCDPGGKAEGTRDAAGRWNVAGGRFGRQLVAR